MKLLILNQVFYPDVVSTAQHSADLARELVERGCQVTVVASSRGYDDPAQRFRRRERWHGVDIYRVAGTAFGKTRRWQRAVDFASFLLSCCWRLLWLPRQDVVLAMTSPPLISVLGMLLVPWKARRLIVWAMDLNPDEAIAAGWLKSDSLSARVLDGLMLRSLRRAQAIIALDRFMKARIAAKGVPPSKVEVIPPWSHDGSVQFDPQGREQFRARHGLGDKFVVMYSGNHSPCHPLDTVLEAARRLRDRQDIIFCFVGGGSEHRRLQSIAAQEKLTNILCLPYQPLTALPGSLSAADLHLVVMGDPFVGIIHPCKLYNILALGAPFAYIGPLESHVTDIAARLPSGHSILVPHGADGELARLIESTVASRPPFRRLPLASEFAQARLVTKVVDVLEAAAGEQPQTSLVAQF